MLAAQAVNAGASALPASPTRSCRLHLPQPGTQRPLGGGDKGLWIRLGPGTPTGQGRPFVRSAHAGALDTEGGSEKEGPAARLRGFPGVPRSPDPRAPGGVPLRMHLTPKLSAATQLLRWGNGGPERGRAGALMLSSGGLPGP